jgi:hypothetical protein
VYLNSNQYNYLEITQNLSVDENIQPFYGVFEYTGSGSGYCSDCYFYYTHYGTMGFYSQNAVSVINSFDMGGIMDNQNGEQVLTIYSNKGNTMWANTILDNYVPGPTVAPLPISVTLDNSKIYVNANYSNGPFSSYWPLNSSQSTSQWFSGNDLFAIGTSYYPCDTDEYCASSDLIQWIRVRKPPPNDVFPITNTID